MHKIIIICLSLLVSSLTSCSSCRSFGSFFSSDSPIDSEVVIEDLPEPDGVEIINSAEITSVIQDFTVELRHDKGLHLERAKTFVNEGIRSIQLEFISQDIIEMCEARELIVDITENLLAKLNQNSILAPEFSRFPFTAANLEFYITFESYYGRYVDPYYIKWICLEDDVIHYYTFDLVDNTKMKWHSRRESYATSREIVVYQREAERKYEETHRSHIDIFGSQRYYPEGTAPN